MKGVMSAQKITVSKIKKACLGNAFYWLLSLFALVLPWSVKVSLAAVPVLEEVVVVGETWESLPAVDADGVRRLVNFGTASELSEVLAQELGIQVQKQGGLGSFATLNLRGAGSGQVAVYLNGLLLNAQGLGVDLGKIPVSQLEAIEIYKSDLPIALSGVRIGGAINLLTRKASSPAALALTLGDFGQRGFSVTTQGSLGVVHGLWQEADNDFSFINDQGTRFNSADDQKERRRSAEVSRYGLLWQKKARTWDWLGHGQWQKQSLPRRDNRPSLAQLTTAQWLFSARGQLGEAWILEPSGLWEWQHYEDSAADIGLRPVDNRYLRQRYALALNRQQTLGNWPLLWRLTLQQENFSRQLRPQDTKNTFSEDFYELAWQSTRNFGAWQWTPSLRWQYQEKSEFLPQLALSWQGQQQLWRLSVGRYQRLPALSERFGDQGYLLANPDLKAETGYRADLFWQQRLSRAFSYEIGIFASEINGVIVYTYNARGLGKPENLAAADIVGLEARVVYGSQRFGRWQWAATWQEAKAQSPQPAVDGKRLAGRFARQFLLAVDYPLPSAWRLHYQFLYEDGQFYDSTNLLPAPTKRQHDLSLSWQHRDWQWRLSLLNALDAATEDFNGFPGSGREWRLQLQKQF